MVTRPYSHSWLLWESSESDIRSWEMEILCLWNLFIVVCDSVNKFWLSNLQHDREGLPKDWEGNSSQAYELCSRKPHYNRVIKLSCSHILEMDDFESAKAYVWDPFAAAFFSCLTAIETIWIRLSRSNQRWIQDSNLIKELPTSHGGAHFTKLLFVVIGHNFFISIFLYFYIQEHGKQVILQHGKVGNSKYIMEYR